MWQPRNDCDGILMEKILIMTIQVNLCTKYTWIISIKFFVIPLNYHYSYFLAASLDYITYFTQSILYRGCTFIYN